MSLLNYYPRFHSLGNILTLGRLRVLFLGAICCFLLGCHPAFISDQALKDRFAHNRADFDELVRLIQSPGKPEITIEASSPVSLSSGSGDIEAQKKIHALLSKTGASSISLTKEEIVIQIGVADADLLRGRHYYFMRRLTAPPSLVPSLHGAYPYKELDCYHMKLDNNWCACVFED